MARRRSPDDGRREQFVFNEGQDDHEKSVREHRGDLIRQEQKVYSKLVYQSVFRVRRHIPSAYLRTPLRTYEEKQFQNYIFQRHVLNRKMITSRGIRTVWEENSPDSLVDLAARCVLRNPETLFYAIDVTRVRRRGGSVESVTERSPFTRSGKWEVTEHEDRVSDKGPRLYERETHSVNYEQNGAQPPIHLRLRPEHQLPIEICEQLLSVLHDEGFDLNDCVLTAFGDPSTSRLRRVHLRHSTLTDLGLKALLKHKLRELDIVGCAHLTEASLEELNHQCCDSLIELSFSGNHPDSKNSNSLFPAYIASMPSTYLHTQIPPATTDTSLPESDNHSTTCKKSIVLINEEGDDVLVKSENCHANIRSTVDIDEDLDGEDELDEEDRLTLKYPRRGYILNTPKLQRLCMRDLEIARGPSYFPLLFRSLTHLTHLDMSSCDHRDGIDQFKWLPKFLKNTLHHLVLHNVGEIDARAISNIVKLKKLRHLDISQYKEKFGTFVNPNSILKLIAEGLPELGSLDISGTNLAGNGVFNYHQIMNGGANDGKQREEKEDSSEDDSMSLSDQERDENIRIDSDSNEEDTLHRRMNGTSPTNTTAAAATLENKKDKFKEMPKCDVVGLISRVDRPLDFLGLYKAQYEACCRAHIPAKEVSGDLNEAQILIAGQRYLNRPMVLESVLNDLFHIFRYENCCNFQESLDIILLSMDRHPGEKVIQISGSASLYYVVKSEPSDKINVKVKQKILATLLNAMFAHKDDAVMMRNGCLTLCQFCIPQDVIFDYERLVQILLYIVAAHNDVDSNFVQRAGICLLNSLACQVDGRQKLLVGDLGAMEKMLGIIQEKLRASKII